LSGYHDLGREGDKGTSTTVWKKGETYDQILRRLMSIAEYEGFMEMQYERLKDREAFVALDEI